MMPTHPPAHELNVREMPPDRRHAQPRWEVTVDRQVIGWVQRSQRRSVIFFEAIAVHPTTGEHVGLELSTDRDERVEVIRRFWFDPLTSKQHLPRHLRLLHGLA
ncbi:hypothetical protein BH09ACT5_BH09ACT5_01290 [soil metagenome]